MYLLPSNLRIVLAASCCLLVILGAVIGVASFIGQTELVVISAMALTAVALGSFLLLSWQVAQVLRAQGRLLDRLSGRLTIFEEQAELEDTARKSLSLVPKGGQAPHEDDTRQSQRIEAYNRLRDGIVHDLNNRLMVIGANVDTVARQLRDQPALQRKLLSALVAVDQAGSLIARSSAFTRRHVCKIQHVDLRERIDSIAALMSRSLLRDTVELRVSVEEGLWGVQADPNDLETAIVTLCANLRDTLLQGDVITLEVQNVAVSKGTLSRPDLEGDFVRIAIGTGALGDMPNDMEKRSEGVFTMQDMDLSSWVEFNWSLNFLQPLGGMAEVVTLGMKSAIALYLPRAKAPSQIMPPAPRDEGGVSERASTHTEILIVDDELEVALALQTMLEEFGYIARIATDAGQVLKTLKARKPGLLLTDVAMPGSLSGIMLAREVRQIFPDLPILLITGNPVIAEDESEFPLLQKPIVSRLLHAAIQKQLAQGTGKVVSLFPKTSRRMH